jgi:hypothetical protein
MSRQTLVIAAIVVLAALVIAPIILLAFAAAPAARTSASASASATREAPTAERVLWSYAAPKFDDAGLAFTYSL